jgi:hypothetical protein
MWVLTVFIDTVAFTHLHVDHTGWAFASKSSTGSDAAVTADVIYRAVIDPDPTAVRYYSAPDSVSIPRAKRILGLDGYWQEFRSAVLGDPSDLWKTLMAKPGSTPVDMEV